MTELLSIIVILSTSAIIVTLAASLIRDKIVGNPFRDELVDSDLKALNINLPKATRRYKVRVWKECKRIATKEYKVDKIADLSNEQKTIIHERVTKRVLEGDSF